MKNLIKYVCSLLIIITVFFVYKSNKQYIYNNIFSIYSKNKDHKEIWGVYLTKDYKLVICNEENYHLENIKFGSLDFFKNSKDYYLAIDDLFINAMKERLIEDYIDILTYMIVDHWKGNFFIKNKGHLVLQNTLIIGKKLTDILSKTYIELKKDNNLKNDVRLVREDDIIFTKKANVYVIIIGDRIINILFELEVLLNDLERRNINTVPERKYLNLIKDNKY